MAKYLNTEKYKLAHDEIKKRIHKMEAEFTELDEKLSGDLSKIDPKEVDTACFNRTWACASLDALRGAYCIMNSYADDEPEENEILTKEEKTFLRTWIELYRDRIIGIMKCGNRDTDSEHLYIGVKSWKNGFEEGLCLPSFQLGTQFKDMELYKMYTLEELGLEEE